MHRSTLAIALAAAALAAVPAAASATSYCVSDAACTAKGGIDEGANLQKALDDASAHAGPDAVRIGAGTFSGGPYAYHNLVAGEEITVTGAGPAATVLSSTGPQQANKSILDLYSATSTVSELGVTTSSSSGSVGIANLKTLNADHVAVTAPAGANLPVGLQLLGGGSVTRSTVSTPLVGGGVGVGAQGQTLIADSDLTGYYGVNSQGDTTIRRTHVRGNQAVRIACANATVEDSQIEAEGSNLPAAVTVGPQNGCATTISATVRQSSLDNSGNGQYGVYIGTAGAAQVAASVTLTDSLVRGFPVAVQRSGLGVAADVTVKSSDLFPSSLSESGPGTLTMTSTIAADPKVVGGEDLHPLAGSPLIDGGSTALLAAGESPTDLDGQPRIAGSARDIGAYEVQPAPAPAASGGGGGGGGGGGDKPAKADEPSQSVPAAPATPPVLVTPPSGAPARAVVTDAQLRASLRAAIAAARSTRYAFAWPVAGTLRIEWRIGTHVVATGSLTRGAAGANAALTLKPTKAGGRLLRRHHRVTVRASFARAAGGARVTTSAVRRTA